MSRGDVVYDFVEVMACPGGCIAGGGTPRKKNNYQLYTDVRQKALYAIDEKTPVRESHNNPEIIELYSKTLTAPGSHLAHELLHCEYRSKKAQKSPSDIRKLWQGLSARYTETTKKR